MATWDFDVPTQNTKIQGVQNYLTENLQSTTAGTNAARMLDLYNFLHTRTFVSPQQVQQSITKDGVPLFTPEEAKQVFDQLKMRGGGESVEFFDSMARKLASYTGDFIPESAKGYVYFLKALEQNPDQGPLVSTMLDIVGQGLPTIAASIQTLAPQIIGALPIPSAAVAGIIIGWVMSAFLLFLAIITNLSRKKFGAAFVTASALIPIVGTSMMNAAKSAERITGKMSDRRARLVESVQKVFGPAGESITQYIPDLRETGIEDVIPKVSVPTLDSAKAFAASKISALPSLDAAKAFAASKVPSLDSAKNMLTRKPV